MAKKKILMLTTGGTIASAPTEGGLAPQGSNEILSHMGINSAGMDFDLEVREILTLDSSNIQPEEWKIIEGTHEPILDRNTWERVQRLRAGKRRNCSTGEKDKFAGLVVCADCGKPMYNIRAKTLTHIQESFVCGNYRRKPQSCTAHFIRMAVVLANVQEVLACANEQREFFR